MRSDGGVEVSHDILREQNCREHPH
jgi:hypothetical protein